MGEENISKGFDSNHVLGFLKSQKFTELLRKYTKIYIGLSAQELNVQIHPREIGTSTSWARYSKETFEGTF